jgi:hypothetical protein
VDERDKIIPISPLPSNKYMAVLGQAELYGTLQNAVRGILLDADGTVKQTSYPIAAVGYGQGSVALARSSCTTVSREFMEVLSKYCLSVAWQ